VFFHGFRREPEDDAAAETSTRKRKPHTLVATLVLTGISRMRLCSIAVASAVLAAQTALAQAPTAGQLRQEALELAYNLDHDQAIALLRRAVALAPDDPAPHRSLAAVVWLNMLFRRGAVTVDHYLGSFTRTRIDLAKPPPELDAEFRRHLSKAIELARRRVAERPNDAQAHYDLGSALGLEASYLATVEGRMLSGFNRARHAYDAHERAIEIDRSRRDAGLIVGTYRYVVSTLSLPMRWMAYVVGFGGGKERGIEMLEQTAAHPGDARVDAMFALILMYNRERRYDDAMRVLQALRRECPRNRLVVLEAGSTALRAGRPQEAEQILTEGMAMAAKDTRPRVPGEDALWRYKRGAARASAGRTDAALEDLRIAASGGEQPWVTGRARVELGRLALKRGDRAGAAAEARQAETLCARGNDPVCVQDARKLLRNAHGR
jgi:tetratricopeptide (TPR) repeat protein